MIELSWLVPVFPALGFVIIAFITNRYKMLSAIIAILAMAASLIISTGILREVLLRDITMENPVEHSLTWLSIPGLTIEAGVLIDPLSAVMLMVVSIVALLVIIYSVGYMKGDPGFSRYFGYISFFGASMLGLVIANNYFQMYVFWELVGLCSYLLIGFYFYKNSAVEANKKAFITNRVADFGFLLGIFFIFYLFGTFNFIELSEAFKGFESMTLFTVAAILIFFGPIGKSAQFPLHVWLPDAMEGPTPVSALIHAATMVAAGVFLLARQFALFHEVTVSMLTIAYIGGFTAIFAATIAVVQNDIKRILAFSTVSQLGLMVMAIGAGSITAGMFHLTTHAFFKALLFLGAGSVIHAVHSNNIWKMGALYKKMKITTWTFIIGALALVGIPPLAGYWSKDLISSSVRDAGFIDLYYLAYIVSFLTAFYMFRLIFAVFFGSDRTEFKPHESPLVMTLPLIILAVFSIFIGFINSPLVTTKFANLIYFDTPYVVDFEIVKIIPSLLVGFLSITLAWLIYSRQILSPEYIKQKLKPIYIILYNKYYIDEIYSWFFNKVVLVLAGFCNWYDRKVVDGILDGSTDLLKLSGAKLRLIQTGNLQNYALIILVSVVLIVLWAAIPVLGGR